MTQCWALEIEQNIDEEGPMTPEEQRIFEIGLLLDEAFRRDPSIVAMNRVYRMFRTGDAEIDRAIRDYIGLLYLLERAKPALLRAAREGGVAANGHGSGHQALRVVDAMNRLRVNVASESERSHVEV